MEMTIDWNEAAVKMRREVQSKGGFLSMQKEELRDRFGIGRLTENNVGQLDEILEGHQMFVFPSPYYCQSFRIYDRDSQIGRIAEAIADSEGVPETALKDAVELFRRANMGKDRRSDDVPWLQALDVFLQLVIGRPPEGWEDLDDDREPIQLVKCLAESLGLPAGVDDAKTTRGVAGAVCACRPHRLRWEGADPGFSDALAEAGRKQKEIFDGVLREAAKVLLEGSEIPSRDVELGRLGLRYRREAQGGIGWIR